MPVYETTLEERAVRRRPGEDRRRWLLLGLDPRLRRRPRLPRSWRPSATRTATAPPGSTSWASRHPWETWDDEARDAPAHPAVRPVTAPMASATGSTVTLNDPTVPQWPTVTATRYLFFEAQQGIRVARVQPASRYTTVFDEADAPNPRGSAACDSRVMATSASASMRGTGSTDRALSVDLIPAAHRVTARATPRRSPSGHAMRPVTGSAASVVLRAVDEKLFAIGRRERGSPSERAVRVSRLGRDGSYATHGRRPSSDPRVATRRAVRGRPRGLPRRHPLPDGRHRRHRATRPCRSRSPTISRPGACPHQRSRPTSRRAMARCWCRSGRPCSSRPRWPASTSSRIDPQIPVRVFGSAVQAGRPRHRQGHVEDARVRQRACGRRRRSRRPLVALPRLTAGTHTITFSADRRIRLRRPGPTD